MIVLGHVVFHIRYTARQGVDPSKVKETLRDIFEEGSKSNLALLFSLRHDFPTEGNAFDKSEKNAPFTATIRKNYFPYFTQGRQITIVGYHIYDGEDVTRHEEIDKERWNEATTSRSRAATQDNPSHETRRSGFSHHPLFVVLMPLPPEADSCAVTNGLREAQIANSSRARRPVCSAICPSSLRSCEIALSMPRLRRL